MNRREFFKGSAAAIAASAAPAPAQAIYGTSPAITGLRAIRENTISIEDSLYFVVPEPHYEMVLAQAVRGEWPGIIIVPEQKIPIGA